MSSADPISGFIDDARLIVCAGPGGVGKTTTSAALGLAAALRGRKVIVLTIDPARRLANSLGLDALTNEPQKIELHEHIDDVEVADGGELWAMMLDQKKTLDDLVSRFAPDKGALERSKENNIYRLLSSALAGMQEYMALDKLHDLYTGGYYDLVVLDTPPTKNALEFLETPDRARKFFDDRVLKWFLPDRSAKKGLLSRVFNAGSVVISMMAKVFGQSFVDDLIEFFDTLQFLQEALRSRGEMIDFILRDPLTRFLVITSADNRRVQEAIFFHRKLDDLNQEAAAFVLNRVLPSFQLSDVTAVTPSDLLAAFEDDELSDDDAAALTTALENHYAHLARLSEHTREVIDSLASQVGAEKLQTVPMFGQDVHDLATLRMLSRFLAPGATS
jgi:anion-transporting  ArsA/GET3 family ATPase